MVWYFPQLRYLYFGSYAQPVFQITSYLAAIIAATLVIFFLREEKEPDKHIIGSGISCLVGFLFGARILYYLGPSAWGLPVSTRFTEILMIWKGGYDLFGGCFGTLLCLFLYMKWNRLNFPKYIDVYAVVAPIALAVVRIGCLITNDHLEKKTSLFFGLIRYTKPDLLPWSLTSQEVSSVAPPVFPAVFFELIMVAGLATLMFFLYHKRNKPFDGALALFTLVYYPPVRFIAEFFREYTFYICGLTFVQILCIIVFLAALVIIRRKKYNLINFLQALFGNSSVA
jgi:prolipoprotein diacylglyceryltransferase